MVSEGECEEETLLEIKDYIIKYSDGVFMWVTLVLRDLERYIDNGGYTRLSLNTRLRSLPKELGGKDGFYRAKVDSLIEKYKDDQEQQEQGRRILAWVTFAQRPILVTELRDALATPSKLEGTELSTYVLEDNRPHQLDKAILSSCGGLAEVRDSHSGPIVQLIHQTAREFLLHEDKHAKPYHLEEVQGDTEIAMTCCRYLSIAFRPEFPPTEANAELTKVEMMIIRGWATLRGGDGHEAGLILLLNLGADVNSKDTVGRTPISYAVEKGHEHGLQLLIQHGANVDSKDGAGRTPLSYAAENGHKDILELLLDLGADVNSNDTAGRTPLSYAAENGHESSVKLLLNNGAYLQLKDTAGRTPLSYAAENGHTISVKVLLQGEGVEFNSADTSGRTPLSYATANGHTAVVELLQSYATR
ncbi:hypothetical protein VE00_06189 [Pseudogymnoascus sp. WSF 3629]|nr:hypothetical protein VE00_06189 [Pseudogymnoascus sp. WSF 3629]